MFLKDKNARNLLKIFRSINKEEFNRFIGNSTSSSLSSSDGFLVMLNNSKNKVKIKILFAEIEENKIKQWMIPVIVTVIVIEKMCFLRFSLVVNKEKLIAFNPRVRGLERDIFKIIFCSKWELKRLHPLLEIFSLSNTFVA